MIDDNLKVLLSYKLKKKINSYHDIEILYGIISEDYEGRRVATLSIGDKLEIIKIQDVEEPLFQMILESLESDNFIKLQMEDNHIVFISKEINKPVEIDLVEMPDDTIKISLLLSNGERGLLFLEKGQILEQYTDIIDFRTPFYLLKIINDKSAYKNALVSVFGEKFLKSAIKDINF